jgi:hypothetical protein
MKEERLRVENGGHDLRVFYDDTLTHTWEVWLEPMDGSDDGVCLGDGKTRDEAVGDAVNALEAALAKLQETPSPEAEAKLRATFDTGDEVLREDGTFESLTEPAEED